MTSELYRDPASLPAPLRFLAGGGEATRLILERDWTGHPLGDPADWPDILKSNLSTILNSPESMILAWGTERMTFFFNETYVPLLGPRVSWAMGSPFDEVWADAWAQAKPIIDDAFAGRSRRFENLPWRLDTDRGSADTWFTFSYSRILDPRGAVAGLFILTNETTAQVVAEAERRRTDERLRQSESRFRLMADAAPVIMWITDPDGRVEFFNQQWSAYTGAAYRPETAADVAASFVHPDDGAATMAAFDAARGSGGTFQVEHRIRGADGRYRWFLVRAEPYQADPGGDILHWFGASVDIHDRRVAEAAQRDSEVRLRELAATLEQQVAQRTTDRNRLWQLSTDLMLVAGLDGRIEAVNPAWTRILGWTERELVGVPLFDFVHPDDVAHTLAGASGIGRGESYARFENRYRHRDGSFRDIVWAAGPGDGRIIAVGRDATEEKAAAAALAAAEGQLRQAQKMEAVGQLTGGLAHDFNNLLTGMMGNLELLQLRVAGGRLEDIDRFVLAAQGAGRRAAALTQRLLAFSRRQTLDPRPADVNRLIAGMEDLIRRTIGPANQLEVVGAGGLWTANIDAGQLENAILNLCINARDAMPDGGRITIETANKWLDERTARSRDLDPGQYLSVCVTDTGTGMDAATIQRAFEPFFTTKPIGQGTGLGLSMIYGFAHQSGGQVRIYSEEGMGTTVCIYLPRHLGAAPEELAEGHGTTASAGSGTILVVDDEATIRHLIDEVLDDAGYTVINAADGAAGLKVLQSGARIDLLITDVGLPGGMNGRQVADAARHLRPGLKVLFITGYAENAAVGNGHLEHGMELLTKPFSIEALTGKVGDMMRKG